jgi:hypothetical protein
MELWNSMPRMLSRFLMIGADVTTGSDAWILAPLILGIAIAAGIRLRRLRGTTLAAPAVWALASMAAMAVVEGCLAWRGAAVDPLTASLCRYAAAVSTFCPLVAVLGAKRPQDRGWQWVVFSLWIVLLVPVMQAVAARSGERLELFGAWRLLLAALVAMGLLNYLPTRYAASAILLAVGQTLLLGPFQFNVADEAAWRRAGVAGILAAVGFAYDNSRRRGGLMVEGDSEAPLRTFNERWIAFRDSWGAFWGLRVLQRVNQTAELSQWPVRLQWWDGFEPASATVDADTAAQIQQTLDSLLRRFERMDRD